MRHRTVATAVVAAVLGSFALDEPLPVHAQDQSGPAFEVASVKPNESSDRRIAMGLQPGGRYTASGVTLKMLIGTAYGMGQPLAPSQILGGPDWIDRDRFDIVAKAEGDIAPGPDGCR